ncbi:P1 family peptidase [Agrococcus sp. ARC_14]|uniref:P1 family peptidase n=1 Tax=Agrococcus sp. ARC_14 TaxID=2919927 RepID=UPI001F061399|nr:P1 family peptidase [Agrococcus sp. ARC_14]MCH1881808.1 P1 family peptidase [Agrococcus sp. ARC_14]
MTAFAPQTTWDAEPRRTPRSSFAGLAVNADAPLEPVPGTARAQVAFDFPGVTIGTAEYAEGPTGVTVIEVAGGARTAIDDRGGAVGIVGRYPFNHAIALAGGSVHGLAAASGVTDALMEREGRKTGFADLQVVSGACIYDFAVRDNAITPDNALGRAALAAAVTGTAPVGRVGAGVGGSCGKTRPDATEWAGQGVAFRQVGELKVLALVVVNAVGAVFDRDGSVLRGNLQTDGTRRHPVIDGDEAFGAAGGAEQPGPAKGNTTLSVVVTNARLAEIDLQQLATQIHSSMHRGIQPFHTSLDGDTLFLLTTDEVDLPVYDPRQGLGPSIASFGAIASETMWDAIIESVR